MPRFDVLVLGSTHAAHVVASRLAEKKLTVALVRPPGPPPDAFRTVLNRLAREEIAHPNLTGVSTFDAPLRFESASRLSVGTDVLEGKNVVLALGADAGLTIPGLETCAPLGPDEAVDRPAGGRPFLLIGDGVMGLATAAFFASRGHRAILFETDDPAGFLDPALAEVVRDGLKQRGIETHRPTAFVQAASNDGGVSLVWEEDGVRRETAGRAFVSAEWRRPRTAGLDLPRIRVFIRPDGRVAVDDALRTSNPAVWALGAVTDPLISPSLEDHHTDMVVENLTAPFFSRLRLEPDPIPFAVAGPVPFAFLGPSSDGGTSRVSAEVRFGDSETGGADGFLKVVGHRRTGGVLGAHAAGAGAAETILFFDLLARAGISLFEVGDRHHFPSPGGSNRVYNVIKTWVDQATP